MTPDRTQAGVRLRVVPIELRDANRVVDKIHRHHDPVVGHRFSIAAVDGAGEVRGVAIVGRPVARPTPDLEVLEVLRVATDGTKNACSILLGAAARAGRALGYVSIQTYTLPAEGGASLRGAGWTNEGEAGGGQWKHTDGKPRKQKNTATKTRWRKTLNPARGAVTLPAVAQATSPQANLFATENA